MEENKDTEIEVKVIHTANFAPVVDMMRGNSVHAQLDKGLLLDIGETAVVSAVVSGINGMVKEGQECMNKLNEGEMDNKEMVVRIVRTGGKNAATAGAKAAMAVSIKEGVRAISRRVGWRQLWRVSIKYNNAFTAIAFGMVDQGFSTYKWVNGKLSDREFKIDTLQNMGAASGSIGGAATGAAIGSIVPGVGTTMGAVMGAYLGSQGGSSGGKKLGEDWFPEEEKEEKGEE